MRAFIVLVSAVLAASVPLTVVHETRLQEPGSLSKRRLEPSDAVIPVRIGLQQRNLDKGYDHLMKISSPSSPDYGKHWTVEQVHAEFAPLPESADVVQDWLTSSGIVNAKQSMNRAWIAFNAPVQQVEKLLDTTIYQYEDDEGGIRLGCDEYSLPKNIAALVDYVTPGVKLSPRVRVPRESAEVSGLEHKEFSTSPSGLSRTKGSIGVARRSDSINSTTSLANCGDAITPACIRALYDIPFPQGQIGKGDLGVFEDGDAYAQYDLNQFFQNYAPYVPQDTHPELVSINGAEAPTTIGGQNDGGESDIDFSLAYGILGDVPITLYQVQDPNTTQTYPKSVTFFDPFLDAVDSSFCDQYEHEQGFQCGGASLTTVVSMSYSTPELGYQTLRSQQRVCNEFMKLTLQGHTIVSASGDYGVGANPAYGSGNCYNNGCYPSDLNNTGPNSYNGSIFLPQFPANCPYILAVGATQLLGDETVEDPESAMDLGPGYVGQCDDVSTFASSGGFSNYFPRPTYQDDAISEYFKHHDPGYPYYNSNYVDVAEPDKTTIGRDGGHYARFGRGIPDVSANGANLSVYVGGYFDPSGGTSLATPIWASLIALINGYRKAAGKNPVGFVQPVLYENPDAFHDITSGSNPGCGTKGFSAVKGWDPITGLGTPNFPKLRDIFQALP